MTARARVSATIVKLAVVALVGVSTAVATIGLGASPSAAHTDLLQASPGVGQRAGGTIEFLDLAFTEPVTEAVVEVTFDGETVPGSMLVDEGIIIRYVFDDALAEPGRYDVRYEMISFDTDFTERDFFFTYDPEAPPPIRLGTVIEERNWTPIIASGVFIASMLALAFLFLSRLESRRRLRTAADGESELAP
ncbi:MAG: copper resistance protein CopC [Actinomycetota bacterium]